MSNSRNLADLKPAANGVVGTTKGGTGEITRQAAMDALAGAVTSGSYLRGDGTDVVMATIQVADVPTLNQNTTGSSGSCTGNAATATTSTNQSGGTVSATSIAYSTTLTGGTGIVNLGSGQFYKDASGNVGIGTSSPAFGEGSGIEVSRSGTATFRATSNSQGVEFRNNAGTAEIDTRGAFPIKLLTNQIERARIDSSGNVGIGTGSPSSKLHVVSSSGENKIISEATAASQQASLSLIVQAATPGQTVIYMGKTGATTNGQLGYDPNTNTMTMYTNNTERARIDSSGNFLVGTTTSTVNPGISLLPTGRINIGRSNDDAVAEFYRSGTRVGQINVTTTATSYITSSDYRLKEAIAPMTGALAKVALLKPVTYKWKSTGEVDEGFIAHELQAVCPSAVTGEKDAVQEEQYEVTPAVKDEKGNTITEAVMGTRTVPAYQGIDTSFLVATLTAAIQEQQALITALTTRITALESAP